MKKILPILISILLLSSISCENRTDISNDLTDLVNYTEFGESLLFDMNQIANTIRGNSNLYLDEKGILKSASDYYGLGTDDFISFKCSFQENISPDWSKSDNEFPEYFENLLLELEVSLISSNSSEEFNNAIDKIIEIVIASSEDINVKNTELIYLASLRASVQFMEENFDLVENTKEQDPEEKWWDRWGRCAAAIAGGALTGAGTGFLGGAAVGTVCLPVIGTVSGAAVGAIALGIGGGFTGAAAGC